MLCFGFLSNKTNIPYLYKNIPRVYGWLVEPRRWGVAHGGRPVLGVQVELQGRRRRGDQGPHQGDVWGVLRGIQLVASLGIGVLQKNGVRIK